MKKMIRNIGKIVKYVGITIGVILWVWYGTLKVVIDFIATLINEEITMKFMLFMPVRWFGWSVIGAVVIYFSWLASEVTKYLTEQM